MCGEKEQPAVSTLSSQLKCSNNLSFRTSHRAGVVGVGENSVRVDKSATVPTSSSSCCGVMCCYCHFFPRQQEESCHSSPPDDHHRPATARATAFFLIGHPRSSLCTRSTPPTTALSCSRLRQFFPSFLNHPVSTVSLSPVDKWCVFVSVVRDSHSSSSELPLTHLLARLCVCVCTPVHFLPVCCALSL